MLLTIAEALVPILVTMGFGYGAAWTRQAGPPQASAINQMVMQFALPLSLFVGMTQASRSQLLGNLPVAAVILVASCAGYGVTLAVTRGWLHWDLGRAAIAALLVGGSSSAFVGTSVLGFFFGPATTSVLVTASSTAMQLVQGPITLVLLSIAAERSPAATDAADPADPADHAAPGGAVSTRHGAGTAITTAHRPSSTLGRHVIAAVRQPVVWAPLVGMAFVLSGVTMPEIVTRTFGVLGAATAGASLFAAGIILRAYRITLTVPVGAVVLAKNVLVPAATWAALLALGASAGAVRESLLTLAIPTASYAVIVALQYRSNVRETASVLFWSTVLSFGTMAAFIALTG
ncbi:AEC family transporter [Galbitalea sp. SE-J8]|uniref:AEC family transporter n=1 Tax=Galbitalea sp. SE-J8 TaxID=3054952 RepID=UPI00259C8BE6|nr:AEC family transporter [Galbitalea sp. SE-J8]MDM4761989.1 AEC family transporter [Galbitalea sp. SE-J8]